MRLSIQDSRLGYLWFTLPPAYFLEGLPLACTLFAGHGLWFRFPLCHEIIKKQTQNFWDQQTPSGPKQILCSLTSLGFCFPFSSDLIIPGNSLQRAYLSALWCFNKMLFLFYPAVLALFSWRVGPKRPSLLFLNTEIAYPWGWANAWHIIMAQWVFVDGMKWTQVSNLPALSNALDIIFPGQDTNRALWSGLGELFRDAGLSAQRTERSLWDGQGQWQGVVQRTSMSTKMDLHISRRATGLGKEIHRKSRCK